MTPDPIIEAVAITLFRADGQGTAWKFADDLTRAHYRRRAAIAIDAYESAHFDRQAAEHEGSYSDAAE